MSKIICVPQVKTLESSTEQGLMRIDNLAKCRCSFEKRDIAYVYQNIANTTNIKILKSAYLTLTFALYRNL